MDVLVFFFGDWEERFKSGVVLMEVFGYVSVGRERIVFILVLFVVLVSCFVEVKKEIYVF